MGLIVDSFAGGGGASTGIEAALGRPVDIAINHNPVALTMHRANHPDTQHYCESVWQVDPLQATQGKPVDLLWLSPDCKHFSVARAGRPAEKNIRGLAWVAIKWALAVKPKIIMLENVPEFLSWGPLDPVTGQPVKNRLGDTFKIFGSRLAALGYHLDWQTLEAHHYGAPTTRRRLFLIARLDYQPPVWPLPTHGPGTGRAFIGADQCIDWSLPCPSIFERKRPLADSTARRIARGIHKFLIDDPDPFLVPHGSGLGPRTDHSHLVSAFIAKTSHTKSRSYQSRQADQPLSTITSGKTEHVLITSHMMVTRGDTPGRRMDEPANTLVGSANHFVVVRAFLVKYYSNSTGQKVSDPAHTITSRDRLGLVTVHGADYRIFDIGMRMLTSRELFKCQGFPADYIIDLEHEGRPLSKTAQVMCVGNSVPPPVVAALVKANMKQGTRRAA